MNFIKKTYVKYCIKFCILFVNPDLFEKILAKNPLFFSNFSGWIFIIIIQSIPLLYNKIFFNNNTKKNFALILINTTFTENWKVINRFSEDFQQIKLLEIKIPKTLGDDQYPVILCKFSDKMIPDIVKPTSFPQILEKPFVFVNPKFSSDISRINFCLLESNPKINNIIINNAIIIQDPEIIDESSVSQLVINESLILIDPQIIYEPIIFVAFYNEFEHVLWSWILSLFL